MNFALWTTYWLFTQTIAVVIYVWPVSLFLTLNALAASAFSRIPKNPLQRIALLTPFVWPVLILLAILTIVVLTVAVLLP